MNKEVESVLNLFTCILAILVGFGISIVLMIVAGAWLSIYYKFPELMFTASLFGLIVFLFVFGSIERRNWEKERRKWALQTK